jgi:hypothetical protein
MQLKFIVLTLALLGYGFASKAEPLKVKPGVWETTTVTEKSGSRPTNLDTLTPEQRAKVEKKLAERVKKETHTVKSCLNASRIKSGDAFVGSPHRASCTKSFNTQTASDVVATIGCSGTNPMTGNVAMHAADAKHMSGKVDMTYGSSGKLQLFTHSRITAVWLKEDCSAAGKKSQRKPH